MSKSLKYEEPDLNVEHADNENEIFKHTYVDIIDGADNEAELINNH